MQIMDIQEKNDLNTVNILFFVLNRSIIVYDECCRKPQNCRFWVDKNLHLILVCQIQLPIYGLLETELNDL